MLNPYQYIFRNNELSRKTNTHTGKDNHGIGTLFPTLKRCSADSTQRNIPVHSSIRNLCETNPKEVF